MRPRVPGRRIGKRLGRGGEKNVYRSNIDDEVIGVFHEDSERESVETAKGRYFLTKVLHGLLPEHFPDARFVSTEPQAIGLERVHTSEAHLEMSMIKGEIQDELDRNLSADVSHLESNRYAEVSDQQYVEVLTGPDYQYVYRALRNLGLRNTDYQPENLARDQRDGTLKFVDTLEPWTKERNTGRLVRNYDPDKFKAAIGAINDDRKRKQLERYVERLEQLFEVESESSGY